MSTRRLLLPIVFFAGCVSYGSAQEITEFALPVPGSNPYGITAGPDGNVWFADYDFRAGIPKVGRITPAGAITEFPQLLEVNFLVTGPDGNVWITEDDVGLTGIAAIGRMTPAGVLTEFRVTRRDLGDITVGSDGNLWFAWSTLGVDPTFGIGRITLAGVVTDFPMSSVQSVPAGIAAGPDGAIWFVEPGMNRIGRITTTGVVLEFALPVGSEPTGIVAGPDGNLWFTETFGNKIGRITPLLGTITEFPVPTAGSRPMHITSGSDGNLWFTEALGGKIGRITTSGVVTEFPIPTPDSRPFDIAAGPDGAIWFTENLSGKIGRISTGLVATPARILPVVGSTVGALGTFFRTTVQLHNPAAVPVSGRIVFHPSGSSGSESDPGLSFSLAPGQSQTIADLLPAMDRSGLGSADVLSTLGNAPIVAARVFNDAGATGTTGFTEEGMRPEEALRTGQQGVLFVPADLVDFRLNIGIRTLQATLMTFTVRNASGAIAAAVPKFFPATYHEQQPAGAFLNGLSLPAGGSVTATVEVGAAIVYGATVDNRTGDPSLQVARAAP